MTWGQVYLISISSSGSKMAWISWNFTWHPQPHPPGKKVGRMTSHDNPTPSPRVRRWGRYLIGSWIYSEVTWYNLIQLQMGPALISWLKELYSWLASVSVSLKYFSTIWTSNERKKTNLRVTSIDGTVDDVIDVNKSILCKIGKNFWVRRSKIVAEMLGKGSRLVLDEK